MFLDRFLVLGTLKEHILKQCLGGFFFSQKFQFWPIFEKTLSNLGYIDWCLYYPSVDTICTTVYFYGKDLSYPATDYVFLWNIQKKI